MSFAEWFNSIVNSIPPELIIPGSIAALTVLLLALFAVNTTTLRRMRAAQQGPSVEKELATLNKRLEAANRLGGSPAATGFKPIRRSKRKHVPAIRSAQPEHKRRA
ncbi:MAG: hypothetical protein GC184_12475 [Rhizobiales bacterium]|nr:hypothetical protein [Hyphomicrobiales bacterium]